MFFTIEEKVSMYYDLSSLHDRPSKSCSEYSAVEPSFQELYYRDIMRDSIILCIFECLFSDNLLKLFLIELVHSLESLLIPEKLPVLRKSWHIGSVLTRECSSLPDIILRYTNSRW